MAAPEQAQGIGKQVMDGLQWLGEKSIELASKGVQVAASGLGALIAMIPGMSGLGEAVAVAGAGRDTGEKSSSTSSQIVSTPTQQVAASQQLSSNVADNLSPETRQFVASVADRFAGAVNVVQSVGREMLGEMSPGYTPPVQVLAQGRDQGFSRGA